MTTHMGASHRRGATLLAFTAVAAASLLTFGTAANAATAPTVPLGTSGNYNVLAASTVTNTGASTMLLNVGVSPGTSITGFPPGIVVPPANINRTNAAAAKARADLTAGYLDAAGRPITATTTSNLANKHLQAGVYAGPSKSPLSLTGSLVLDGAGDPSSVFVFQTDSTLITASRSTITLVNGAQDCNVFWQVGSSATLGSGSVFRGNILALTSISLNAAVTVHGRALARNGAVTLINDTFVKPTCATAASTPPTTPVTAPGGGATTPAAPGAVTPAPGPGGGTDTGGGPSTPSIGGPPRTDATPIHTNTFPWSALAFVTLLSGAGIASAVVSNRRFRVRSAAVSGNHTRLSQP